MQRLLAPGIQVGDFITSKRDGIWWKVEAITAKSVGLNSSDAIVFNVVNKDGYRKWMIDFPGAGRRWYRWIPSS